MMVFKNGIFFMADTTVCIEPTPAELAETAILAADKAQMLDIEPKVAMLSFSNFGSVNHPLTQKVKRAVEIVKERAPYLKVDGEMQADTAVVPEILDKNYPFANCQGAGQRPDLPGPELRQHLLQTAGTASAGPRPSARSSWG